MPSCIKAGFEVICIVWFLVRLPRQGYFTYVVIFCGGERRKDHRRPPIIDRFSILETVMTLNRCSLMWCFAVFFIFTISILSYTPTISYLHTTYLSTTTSFPNDTNEGQAPRIPNIVHQIYFTFDNTLPTKFQFAQDSWKRLNPSFIYKLWNSSMVHDLVRTYYPQLYSQYLGYPSWLNRQELGRYVIIHKYGGMYVDMDMQCKSEISTLLSNAHAQNRQVILHRGSFETISNDFFAAVAYSPFMNHVISGLQKANRWYFLPYLNIMFKTSSFFLHGRYRTYKSKSDILTLPVKNNFLIHHHASSWHNWDGKIFVWIYRRAYYFKVFFSVLLCCAIVRFLVLLWNKWTKLVKDPVAVLIPQSHT